MSNATSTTGGTDLDAALARAIRHLIAEATSADDRQEGDGRAAGARADRGGADRGRADSGAPAAA